MKILMISDVYLPRVNGVSTSILTFRRELQRMGHETRLIAPDYGQVTEDESGIFRIPARRVWRDPEDRMMRGQAILALLPDLRAEQFDLIHIQTPFVAHYLGLKLGRALVLPLVETYHTFFEQYLFHYIPFLPRFLLRFAARRFSASQGNQVRGMFVPSIAMRDTLAAYGVRSPLWIVPTGLHLARFAGGNGPAFRARHSIDPQRPMVVYVGRVAFEKNLGFLCQVVARLKQDRPDILWLVAGEGPALPALRREVARLGLQENVHFTGYFSQHQDLLDCYAAGDAFVFASRTETQGLVLLEAMALGVPQRWRVLCWNRLRRAVSRRNPQFLTNHPAQGLFQ